MHSILSRIAFVLRVMSPRLMSIHAPSCLSLAYVTPTIMSGLLWRILNMGVNRESLWKHDLLFAYRDIRYRHNIMNLREVFRL